MAERRRSRRLMGEINVVPYIDVMLVLLIIFMVTAPLLTQGVKVNLPQAGAEPLPLHKNPDDKPLILSIDANGRLFLNAGADPAVPIDDQTLLDRAAAILQATPEVDVLVKGDSAVPYGRVISAMVLLQRAGARKVGFLTDPLPPTLVPPKP
jgi:biopolymer transport protein TolR